MGFFFHYFQVTYITTFTRVESGNLTVINVNPPGDAYHQGIFNFSDMERCFFFKLLFSSIQFISALNSFLSFMFFKKYANYERCRTATWCHIRLYKTTGYLGIK